MKDEYGLLYIEVDEISNTQMKKFSTEGRETRPLIASPGSPACHPVFSGRASSFMHLRRHVTPRNNMTCRFFVWVTQREYIKVQKPRIEKLFSRVSDSHNGGPN